MSPGRHECDFFDSKVTDWPCFAGGEFTRQAEVTFVGHRDKLIIKQQFSGIDEHGHLTIDTELEGRVPQIAFGSSVHIEPYTELYHYSRQGEPRPASFNPGQRCTWAPAWAHAVSWPPERETQGLPYSDHLPLITDIEHAHWRDFSAEKKISMTYRPKTRTQLLN